MTKKIYALLFAVTFSTLLYGQEQLYKVNLLRAKPGELLTLIDVIKEDISKSTNFGISKPYLLRHSQGDHWDLMLIIPIPSLEEYFANSAIENRAKSQSLEKSYGDDYFNLISFQEEAILAGPAISVFKPAFENYSFFHIEIFTSLAGKQSELLEQRQMENEFYRHINHKPNLIFSRVFGPSWDIITIGSYKSLQDFADDGGISFEKEDAAAKKAGFSGVNYIGSYLRSLLLEHHDTLANKVN